MKKLKTNFRITISLLFVLLLCYGCSSNNEPILKEQLRFKEEKLSACIQNIQVSPKDSIALTIIKGIKDKITNESSGLMDIETPEVIILVDSETKGDLIMSLKESDFSKSKVALCKYNGFSSSSWIYEFFEFQTAGHALLLLTDLQMEIISNG